MLMAKTEEKWNRIHARESKKVPVAAVLTRNVALIKSCGIALDIACGKGSNALFLSHLGLEVHAWDISSVAISYLTKEAMKSGANIKASVLDIHPNLLKDCRYDLILNCHYLDRKLTPAIRSALKPGGTVIFQTFTLDKRADIGPTNPKFLLKQNELLQMFEGFDVKLYQDESENLDIGDPLCGRACLIAQKTELT